MEKQITDAINSLMQTDLAQADFAFVVSSLIINSTTATGRLLRELWDESQQLTQRARVRGKFNQHSLSLLCSGFGPLSVR